MCYRLVAGVVKLPSELELILTEMSRLCWSKQRGIEYLQRNFHKKSRYQLTPEEAKQFLSYLQNLSKLF